LPTATHDLADEQDTPERPPYEPGVGLGTTDQALPFQDSDRVALPWSPTAIHDLEDTQETPFKALCFDTRVGLGAIDQAMPFQDSIKL